MSDKPSGFERGWHILEYLRRNTDAEHPVASRSAMVEDCERFDSDMLQYINDKDTFKSALLNLANALNCDADGHPLPQEQWRVIYETYLKKFGVADGAIEDDPDRPGDEEDSGEQVGNPSKPKHKVSPPVHNLYYQHTFSYQEINSLIEGVLFSRTLDTREANLLVKKIEQNLTTKFYPRGPKSICKVRETMPGNWEQLRGNLLLIQRAIDERAKLAFRFNSYNRRRELVPVRETRDIVSPYYCVAYAGRYYLLACQEKQRETGPERRMSIWRIDLMTEMECLGPMERVLDKRQVENLPQEWDETFPLTHLNMSFDKPIPITLRLVNPWAGQDGGTWTNYTFLVDWFGSSFRYERTETEPLCGDIVRVMCSPFGMVNWALQYSDRVEVLEPASVREMVAEKIRGLNRKYGVDGSLNGRTKD